jgi:hypothetical protein
VNEAHEPDHHRTRQLPAFGTEDPGFVDKTVLEPAAGDGNFLVAILQRKLHAIEQHFPNDRWADESLFAIASIYGIELLADNHSDATAAMLDVFLAFHTGHGIPCGPETGIARAATFLIDTNIVRGNTLTGLTPEGDEIKFSWWHRSAADPTVVTREPLAFNSLRADAAPPDLFAAFDEPVRYAPCRIDHVHEEVKVGHL